MTPNPLQTNENEPSLDFIDFTKQKLDCVLQEIYRLKKSDFPHTPGEECLDKIESEFKKQTACLNEIDPNATLDIKRAVCLQVNKTLSKFHKLLGFVTRSTNIRNAFEFFDPLQRLAKQLLGQDAKLILSSEWSFSPLTLIQVFPELPNFVFIGFPASESSNVLIIPIAGHELGHNVWRSKHTGIRQKFQSIYEAKIIDLITSNWTKCKNTFGFNTDDPAKLKTDIDLISFRQDFIVPNALSQGEEIFCDMLGIRIFGEAYLHAFQYLIAPCLGPRRPKDYPALPKRIAYMIQAAQRMGFPTPATYSSTFTESLYQPRDAVDDLLLEISDTATDAIVPHLINEVIHFSENAGIPKPSLEGRKSIQNSFKLVMPSNSPSSFVDIIGAAWDAYLAFNFWDLGLVSRERKFEVLNELTLKTIEVLEFNIRVRETGA